MPLHQRCCRQVIHRVHDCKLSQLIIIFLKIPSHHKQNNVPVNRYAFLHECLSQLSLFSGGIPLFFNLQNDQKQLQIQIKEQEGKLSYITDLLSFSQIAPADFREMKTEYSSKPEKPEAKLSRFDQDQVNISGLLGKGMNNLLKLDYAYETGDIEKKREVISSMPPEKLLTDFHFELISSMKQYA
ncbi:hypothetical protein [Chitinophaga ginsengisegetis]|uniref:hypothetical protein n=1 Tax=Chitinophaga ginsengisegetis TaxID=393003 RepID=UPI0009A7E174|nr:hypothetical protein [Chitinophaga ginsengisegetis]